MPFAHPIKDFRFHSTEILIILGIKTALLDPLPVSLNEIEIGRVGRQEFQFYT